MTELDPKEFAIAFVTGMLSDKVDVVADTLHAFNDYPQKAAVAAVLAGMVTGTVMSLMPDREDGTRPDAADAWQAALLRIAQ